MNLSQKITEALSSVTEHHLEIGQAVTIINAKAYCPECETDTLLGTISTSKPGEPEYYYVVATEYGELTVPARDVEAATK